MENPRWRQEWKHQTDHSRESLSVFQKGDDHRAAIAEMPGSL